MNNKPVFFIEVRKKYIVSISNLLNWCFSIYGILTVLCPSSLPVLVSLLPFSYCCCVIYWFSDRHLISSSDMFIGNYKKECDLCRRKNQIKALWKKSINLNSGVMCSARLLFGQSVHTQASQSAKPSLQPACPALQCLPPGLEHREQLEIVLDVWERGLWWGCRLQAGKGNFSSLFLSKELKEWNGPQGLWEGSKDCHQEGRIAALHMELSAILFPSSSFEELI